MMLAMQETDQPAALSVRDVAISYGKKNVIPGLSFEVLSGETFGLMGLNGAGKTTMIKAVLGLRDHERGAIEIYGQDRLSKASKRRFAYLPERFEPPWFLSGMEFVQFSMRLYDVPFDRDAAIGLAARLALDPDVLGRRVQTYSKGMRQKLGIMATLLTGCQLLVLDEPMSGLDPQARALVKDSLREARAAERTIFLSSHILSDMNEICDRVAVIHEGHMVFIGTPAALKERGGSDNLERAFLQVIGVKNAA